ncbi:SigE family RNA polymerase sigma factor [Catellatospora sichuanensis]|uniref:SigE family RNA polymerase sigma factor n=1 Tax=Catellatospora sichuanensis TaxID=1969805 RepID=UPI001182EE2F|nr:SigE family RNA polymerase sigma factor [Catellatospora sichuanensis]
MTDAESFDEYARSRLPMLARVAYLLTGDPFLADDLVQLTLLRLASRWEQVSAAREPDAYVRRILYTQHVSWWRRVRREALPVAVLPERAAADFTGETVTALAVREALARLAPRQRAVLVLRYFEDLSEAETAAVLGIAVGTVKSQTRDALARLRVIALELSGSLAEVNR